MNYFASASTDIGIVKETNQDSACVKIAELEGKGQAVMALVCDGLGGLSKGELASATLIRRFSDWFEKDLPKRLRDFSWPNIADEWVKIIKGQNEKLLQYGKSINVTLGTTLSAMVIIDGKYMIAHVGDSKIYEVRDAVKQLTEDQTFVNREVKAGRMTPEEAAAHPKRNTLLQCIGASRETDPDIKYGTVMADTVYMFCSDGFKHVLTDAEILENFNPASMDSIGRMKKRSDHVIDMIKKRNERDNITVVLLKSVM